MKNTSTTSGANQPELSFSPGTLPRKVNTVRAGVLAYLLESNTMTGMESVFKQSTTRLAAVIHALKYYGWPIESKEIATGTNDGRIAYISAYWLPQAVIAEAFKVGARTWIERVHIALKSRRKHVDKCKEKAKRINDKRNRHDPRQNELWGM